jgi:hypothetical protein
MIFTTMAKKKSLDHAIHNESVCNYLDKEPNFCDWVITTSFYSSLHYLTAKLFPFNHVLKKAKQSVKCEDFDQYHRLEYHNDKSQGRHERFKCLVEKKCPTPIASHYSRLLELSYTARYTNYNYERAIVDEAKAKLEEIKNFCTGVSAAKS